MPFDPVLMLETAALLLVAFLVGATIGSLLRLAMLRARAAPAVAAAAAPSSDAPVVDALIAAPVIAPLAVLREPVVPTEIEIPDFVAAIAATTAPMELAPARKPGVATSGRDVGRHDRNVPDPPAGPQAETETLELEPVSVPTIASLPISVAPDPQAAAEPEEAASVAASDDKSSASEPSVILAPVDVTSDLLAVVQPSDVAPVETENVGPVLSAADAEAAAMRAIEGNWTPGRRPQPADLATRSAPVVEATVEAVVDVAEASVPAAPDLQEPVAEIAAAPTDPLVVLEDNSTEPMAVETGIVPEVTPQREMDRIVPAEPAEAHDAEPEPVLRVEPVIASDGFAVGQAHQEQPPGVGAPRYGMRDDLTQIVGVLPVVETTLNRLGIYHFDQVADWSDSHARWVETHLGIAGRVDREQWREQARELAAIASGKRPGRKKHPR